MRYYNIDDVDLAGKRVLVRIDVNSPVKNKKIIGLERIQEHSVTIKHLIKKRAKSVLISYQGRIIFNDVMQAELFGVSFMNLQNKHWGNIDKLIRYYLLADTVKTALRSHKLRSRDLWKTDQDILEILENSKDPKIINKLRLLEQGFQFIEDQENPEIDIKNKFRYVNPAFLDKQEVKYLMDVDENYKKFVEESKESNKRGIRGRIVPKKH